MRERNQDAGAAHASVDLQRAARELQAGFPARLVRNLEVVPGDSAPPPCSERLHRRFFRREPRREPLVAVSMLLAVFDLLRSKHPLQEPLAVPLHRLLNPRRFGYVHTHSDNHAEAILTQSEPQV